MKRILFLMTMLIGVDYGHAQSIGYLRYDTVRIQKIGGNGELIIENGTRNITGGVLTNIGNGRTGFVLPSSSGGLGGGNLGSGFRYYVPSSSGVKTAFPGYGFLIDSSSNTNGLTFYPDSLAFPTKQSRDKLIDSLKYVLRFGIGDQNFSGNRLANMSAAQFNWINAGGFHIYSDAGINPRLSVGGASTLLSSPSNTILLTVADDSAKLVGLNRRDDTTGGRGLMTVNKVTGALEYINFSTLPSSGGTTYTYKEALKESSGIVKINNRRDVVIFDQTFTAGSLPGTFTAVGSPSYTADGTGLHFTGTGSGTFAKYIRSNSGTMVENSEAKVYFTVNATTGTDSMAAVGFNSYNTSFGHSIILEWVADASNVNFGKLHFYGSTGSYNSYSDSAKTTYSVNDQFVLSLEREGLNYIGRVQNLTKGWSVVKKIEATTPVTPYIPHNSAYPAFYQRGGSFTVTRFSHTIYAPVVTDAMIVGDSKVLGQGGGNLTRWAANVGVSLNNIISGGGGDATAHVITRLNEIIAINPKRVLLDIGGNDILYAVPSATWQANLVTIYNTLTAAGIEVIFVYPTPRTSTDISAIPAYLDTANVLNLAKKIRTPWYSMLGTGYAIKPEYDGDGTHMNDAGNQYEAYLVNVGLNFPVVLSIQNQNAGAQANANYYISGTGRANYFIASTQTTGTDINAAGAYFAYASGSSTSHANFGKVGTDAFLDSRTNNSTYDNFKMLPFGSTGKVSVGYDLATSLPSSRFSVLNTGTGSTTGIRIEKASGSINTEGQESRLDFAYGTSILGRIALALGSGSNWDMMFYSTNSTSVNSTPFMSALGTNKVGFNKSRPIHGVDITGSLAVSDSAIFDGQVYNRNSVYREAPELKMVVWDSVSKRLYHQTIGSGGGGSGVTNVATGYGVSGGPITSTGTISADTTVGTGLISWYRWAKLRDSLNATLGGGAYISNTTSVQSSSNFYISGIGRADGYLGGKTTGNKDGFKTGGLLAFASSGDKYINIGYDGTDNIGWIQPVNQAGSQYSNLHLTPAGGSKTYFATVTAANATAYVNFPVNTASIASLRIANSGTALTSFNDGDIWNNGHVLRMRQNSATRRFAVTNDAAPSNGQIPIGNGTDYTVANITSTGGTITVTNGSGTIDLSIPTTTLTSGTWTPTITGGANYASSSSVTGKYTRVGNFVTFSISGTVTASAGGSAVVFDASLPIASAMTTQQDLHGAGTASFAGSNETIFVLANDTDDRATLSVSTIGSTSARTFVVTGQYEIK